MKIRLLIIYSIIYGLSVVSFCMYWATNFSRHTIYKGDELVILAQFLLAMTYLFFVVIQFTVKRIHFLFVLLIPLMNCIAALCIGTVTLLATCLTGIPRQYILIYGFLYGLKSLFAVYQFWGKTQKSK
ncbi:MAG: hypothetical protein JWQ27_66 [Ferruginibacter sp.]|nr:hypothetical protein [Ferruginibacter sp.]